MHLVIYMYTHYIKVYASLFIRMYLSMNTYRYIHTCYVYPHVLVFANVVFASYLACINMYICVYAHTHTHIHMHTHAYAHAHTNTHIHTHTCTHAHAHIQTQRYTHTPTHLYIIYIISICTYQHVCMNIYVPISSSICIYTYLRFSIIEYVSIFVFISISHYIHMHVLTDFMFTCKYGLAPK